MGRMRRLSRCVHKTLGPVRHKSDNILVVSIQRLPERGKKPCLVIIGFVIDYGKGYMEVALVAIFVCGARLNATILAQQVHSIDE